MDTRLDDGEARGLTLRRRLRAETGASMAVYAGTIVVVVILVVALAAGMTPVGQSLTSGVSNQICSIFNLSCGGNVQAVGGAEAGQAPVDPRRPEECTVSSRKQEWSGDIKVAVVKVGGGFEVLTQSKRYYDPKTGEVKTRYEVVASDGGSLGLAVGVGSKGEVGNSERAFGGSVEVGGEFRRGDTWEFNTEAEMNAFTEQVKAYERQRKILEGSSLTIVGNYAYRAFLSFTDGYVERPRSADKTSTIRKVESSFNGDAGVRRGKDNEETGGKSTDYNLGAYVEVEGSRTVTTTKDHRPGHEGEYSETLTYSGSGGVGANLVVLGLGWDGSYEGAVTCDYKPGPGGKPVLVGVTLDQVTSGGGAIEATAGPLLTKTDQARKNPVNGSSAGKKPWSREGKIEGGRAFKQALVTQTKLKVTDANRAVVEQWERGALNNIRPDGASVFPLPPSILDPSAPSPNDPMAQLLYEEATNTQSTYNVKEEDFSLGGEAASGLKLGAGYSYTGENQTLVDSVYLGSPSTPGAPRQRQSNLVCK